MAESKEVKPVEEVCRTLQNMEPKFKAALPPQMDPAKFVRVAMMAVQNDPALIDKVSRQSLYNACLLAAQDGLLPDKREAALVIYGNEAKYMPMVGGILKKVRNSGELASIAANVVYKNEVDQKKFRYWIDTEGEHLEHDPLMLGEEKGEPVGVYAIAKTKDGSIYVEVMDKAQVEAVKKMAKTKTIWEGAFSQEMWRKTAIRRLSKRLPMSTDLEQVVHRDDDLYDLPTDAPGPPGAPAPVHSGRLRRAVTQSGPSGPVIDVAAAGETGPKEEAPI